MKVILVMAMTLDGKIARDAEHFPDWTGKEDKKLFARISRRAGAVIMGSKTFLTLKEPLAGRKNVILTRNPSRRSNADNVVFTRKTPPQILEDLEKEGYTEVVLAGGARINTLFARQGLVDELFITVSPLVFGKGICLFDESLSLTLELIQVEQAGPHLVSLHYRVSK